MKVTCLAVWTVQRNVLPGVVKMTPEETTDGRTGMDCAQKYLTENLEPVVDGYNNLEDSNGFMENEVDDLEE